MSKSPDLSAFPIPRKGGARPMSMDLTPESPPDPVGGVGPSARAHSAALPISEDAQSRPQQKQETPLPLRPAALTGTVGQTISGQVVATTVKLDENRYLRLMNAGQPGPGRLKRRSIQDMMVEAVDEWFERRGL